MTCPYSKMTAGLPRGPMTSTPLDFLPVLQHQAWVAGGAITAILNHWAQLAENVTVDDIFLPARYTATS